MSARLRLIGVAILMLVVGMVAGYCLPHPLSVLWQAKEVREQKDASASNAASSIPISLSQDAPAAVPTNDTTNASARRSFDPVTLTGHGQQATKVVVMPAGGYRVSMTHSGSGNFVVILDDDQGRQIDLVTNQAGKANASKVINVQSGSYLFNVGADGNWTIKVEAL